MLQYILSVDVERKRFHLTVDKERNIEVQVHLILEQTCQRKLEL